MFSRSPTAAAVLSVLALIGPPAPADDGPPPVPATRAELKEALEASKRNVPRLPLPPLSEADRARMADARWSGADWSVYNNGRTRKFYLPEELATVANLRSDDPAMTLGHEYQTMLFWIVSRANNCTYCMGHQESKLVAAGMDDDRIASLDGDWSDFPDKDRAGFALARKLTYEPDRMTGDDIARARRFFSDAQVLEIIHASAGFNAMNRWTGALRIPQEEHRAYLTPTAEKYRDAPSLQAPLDRSASRSGQVCARPARRPPLESRGEVEAALEACKAREPRLPLVDDAEARAVVGGDRSSDPVPRWVALLATFPKAGPAKVAMHRASETKGDLAPLVRARIAWIAARNDRAWYALGHARRRLNALGQGDDAIFALDDPESKGFTEGEKAVFSLARKLTVDPALVEDADIAELRKHFPDKQVAEVVFQVTEASYFDRLTEAAGLALER